MWYSSTSHTGRALATRVAPFDDVSYVLVVVSVGGGGGGGGGVTVLYLCSDDTVKGPRTPAVSYYDVIKQTVL